MAARTQAPSVPELAAELNECRQRGLDRLDVDTAKQSPIATPVLDSLAGRYCTRVAPHVHGRIAAIKHLLGDALAAYAQAGNQADAELITELLFPDPAASTVPRPGQMLRQARKQRGVDEKRFREDRRLIFTRFAKYLVTFPSQAATPLRPRRRLLILAGISLVVLLIGGVIVWVSIGSNSSGNQAGPGGNTSPDLATTTTTNPPPLPGSTRPEVVNAGPGARTYRNPRGLTGEGPRIENRRTIQVSCKLDAPGPPSVGRWWYRIVDAPWGNQYYSPANSFLNGDPPTGPYTHDVDPAVPDCPP